MHRKRTRFAARVTRLATALERRGIVATYQVHDRLLANRSARAKLAQQAPQLDSTQEEILASLRADGYAVTDAHRLLSDPRAWQELDADAQSFIGDTEEALARGGTDGEEKLRRRPGKEFVVRKYGYGVELALDDPWLRLGANRRLLDVANTYLGMWSKLEYVDVWYTPPAEGSERQVSQNWHRDYNDRHLLKAFLYLVDVDEQTGPFEYVPRSAPGGELDGLWPWRPLGENYPPQDELAKKIDGRAVTFTGPKGTVILCNTSGFHRGGFAREKPRALATFTYSSPASLAALTEHNFRFVGRAHTLDAPTRFALT
jgi:hypothetical protein